MKIRFLRLPATLLLSVMLLCAPGASSGEDNAAETLVPVDNAASLPSGTDSGSALAADIGKTAAVPSVADNTAPSPPAGDKAAAGDEEELREPNFGEAPPSPYTVSDPIEPLNRAFFVFNEKFYYWVAKPVAKGYNHVFNQDIRVSVRNFFNNLGAPARVANNLLQGEIRATGTELLRFAMNSTMGILGFFDVARDFGIEKREADLGQTLGKYGLPDGMYLVVPFLGTYTLRDGIGAFVDGFLDPVNYVDPWEAALGVRMYRTENSISLRLGIYEELTEPALDPYIAVRDAYIQNRIRVIRGKPTSE
jgi:phospholipid-binding lipoprotein MlaA